jgi:hypothetical protein|tara:strand:+ start:362 stop:523 length:162 start_codon:yes stop_codon:yes gene_type:complete
MNEVPKNWKEEMIAYVDEPHLKQLLREGATSSVTGMALGGLKKRYMKLKGLID